MCEILLFANRSIIKCGFSLSACIKYLDSSVGWECKHIESKDLCARNTFMIAYNYLPLEKYRRPVCLRGRLGMISSPRDAKRMLRKLSFFIKMAKKHAVEVNQVNLNLKLFPGTLQKDLAPRL